MQLKISGEIFVENSSDILSVIYDTTDTSINLDIEHEEETGLTHVIIHGRRYEPITVKTKTFKVESV
jgi:hypothetical protein